MSKENQVIQLNQLIADTYLKQENYIKAFEYYSKNLAEISMFYYQEVDFIPIINNLVFVAVKIASQAEDPVAKLTEIKQSLKLQVPENKFLYAAFAFIDVQIIQETTNIEVSQEQVGEAFNVLCHDLNGYNTNKTSLYQDAQFDAYITNIENHLREYLRKASKPIVSAFDNNNFQEAYEMAKMVFEFSGTCLSKDPNHSVYMANYGISAFKIGKYVEAQKYLHSARETVDPSLKEVVQRYFDDNTKKLLEASEVRNFGDVALDLMTLADSDLLETNVALAVDFVKKAKEIIFIIEKSESLAAKFQDFIRNFKSNAEKFITGLAADTNNFSGAADYSIAISKLLQDIGDSDSRYFDSFAGQNYIYQNDCQHALPLLTSSISIYQELGKQNEVSIIQNWIDGCAGQVQVQEGDL